MLVLAYGHPEPPPEWIAAQEAAAPPGRVPLVLIYDPKCPPDCPHCADLSLIDRAPAVRLGPRVRAVEAIYRPKPTDSPRAAGRTARC